MLFLYVASFSCENAPDSHFDIFYFMQTFKSSLKVRLTFYGFSVIPRKEPGDCKPESTWAVVHFLSLREPTSVKYKSENLHRAHLDWLQTRCAANLVFLWFSSLLFGTPAASPKSHLWLICPVLIASLAGLSSRQSGYVGLFLSGFSAMFLQEVPVRLPGSKSEGVVEIRRGGTGQVRANGST